MKICLEAKEQFSWCAKMLHLDLRFPLEEGHNTLVCQLLRESKQKLNQCMENGMEMKEEKKRKEEGRHILV